MESLPRKRKCAPSASASTCSAARSLQDAASRKRACRESEADLCADTSGLVMTAPPASGGAAAGSAGRGVNRKVGCIDAATRMGRQKRLESEYDLGQEIGQGKFGSVRLCRAKNGGDGEFACKALPKNGEETAHREVEIMQHPGPALGMCTRCGCTGPQKSGAPPYR